LGEGAGRLFLVVVVTEVTGLTVIVAATSLLAVIITTAIRIFLDPSAFTLQLFKTITIRF
jgi:hypothetical protein